MNPVPAPPPIEGAHHGPEVTVPIERLWEVEAGLALPASRTSRADRREVERAAEGGWRRWM
jgi:hypothetical protein